MFYAYLHSLLAITKDALQVGYYWVDPTMLFEALPDLGFLFVSHSIGVCII
jgi:hypothetical protein